MEETGQLQNDRSITAVDRDRGNGTDNDGQSTPILLYSLVAGGVLAGGCALIIIVLIFRRRKQKSKDSRRNQVSDLPDGWIETVDEASGYPMYYNTNTEETSWERPATVATMANPMAHRRDETQLPTGWTKEWDAEGNKYYSHEEGQSQWDPPEGSVGGSSGNDPELLLTTSHVRSDTQLPDGWAKDWDPEGNKYYYNTYDGESSWDPPEGSRGGSAGLIQ